MEPPKDQRLNGILDVLDIDMMDRERHLTICKIARRNNPPVVRRQGTGFCRVKKFRIVECRF